MREAARAGRPHRARRGRSRRARPAAPPSRGPLRRRARSRARSTSRERRRPQRAGGGQDRHGVAASSAICSSARSSQLGRLHHRVGEQAAAHLVDRRPRPRRGRRPRTRCACSLPLRTSLDRRDSRASAAPIRSSGPPGRRSPVGAQRGPRPASARLRPSVPRPAGEPLVGGDVALARAGDDLVRQRRRGRLLVPAGVRDEVAHELLVEARRARPGRVALAVPEARRVRASAPRRSRASSPSMKPNSNFVSARISPTASARRAPSR